MKPLFLSLAIAGVAFCQAGAAPAPTLSEQDKAMVAKLETVKRSPARAALEDQIAKLRAAVVKAKTGHVVIGQVALEGSEIPTDVHAQMLILPGGYFVTAVQTLEKPLCFRMHGYLPVDAPLTGHPGEIVDLGEVKMKKVPAAEQRTLSGILALESKADYSKAEVTLSVVNGPNNSPNNGSSPRPHWPAPVKASVDEDGRIKGNGFSPIGYYCVVKVPGYVQFSKPVSFESPAGADLGTITLERPHQITVTAVITTNNLPFNPATKQRMELLPEAAWPYNPYNPGCPLTLRQSNGEVFLQSGCGPCQFTDLGVGTLEDFAQKAEAAKAEAGQEAMQLKPVKGHVYLFSLTRIPTWPKLLFRVEETK